MYQVRNPSLMHQPSIKYSHSLNDSANVITHIKHCIVYIPDEQQTLVVYHQRRPFYLHLLCNCKVTEQVVLHYVCTTNQTNTIIEGECTQLHDARVFALQYLFYRVEHHDPSTAVHIS